MVAQKNSKLRLNEHRGQEWIDGFLYINHINL